MAAAKKAENAYDERREELVVERKTTWPKEIDVTETERAKITEGLHHDPKTAKKLEYKLCPTGLIRHILVTQEDVDRAFAVET